MATAKKAEQATSDLEQFASELGQVRADLDSLKAQTDSVQAQLDQVEAVLSETGALEVIPQIERIQQLSAELEAALQDLYISTQATGDNRLIGFGPVQLPKIVPGDGHWRQWLVQMHRIELDPAGAQERDRQFYAEHQARELRRRRSEQERQQRYEAETARKTAERIQELEAIANNQSYVDRARNEARRELDLLKRPR
jgi:uncharacterized phage infection (PIP) family protein YhgE